MTTKTIKSQATLILLAVFTILLSSTSWAATYYVDQKHASASDSNAGTEGRPFKTIQKGATKAVAGDTVYVKDGIYKERVIVKNSGAAGKPITLMAYPGDKPIIDGTGVAISGYAGLLHTENKNYIIFDGFHVRNSKALLIAAKTGKGIVIKNCLAHSNSYRNDGIFLTLTTDSLVDNNEAYDCGWNAINLTSTTNTKVTNNYIHDHVHHAAINVFPKTSQAQTTFNGNDIIGNKITRVTNPGGKIYTRYQTNNIIANNLIYDNAGVAIRLDEDRSERYVFQSNTTIANNTLVGNEKEGIKITNATHTRIYNNIIDSNGGTISIASKANKGQVIDCNMYYGKDFSGKGSNGFYGNPRYINKSTHDYALTAESPAKDKGEDLSYKDITKDILGDPRPQGKGFDIGAFEYQEGIPNGDNGPTPPMNVRVASK